MNKYMKIAFLSLALIGQGASASWISHILPANFSLSSFGINISKSKAAIGIVTLLALGYGGYKYFSQPKPAKNKDTINEIQKKIEQLKQQDTSPEEASQLEMPDGYAKLTPEHEIKLRDLLIFNKLNILKVCEAFFPFLMQCEHKEITQYYDSLHDYYEYAIWIEQKPNACPYLPKKMVEILDKINQPNIEEQKKLQEPKKKWLGADFKISYLSSENPSLSIQTLGELTISQAKKLVSPDYLYLLTWEKIKPNEELD